MGPTDSLTYEQVQGLTISAPAAGLLHGAVRVLERDRHWMRPARFAEEQLRAFGSCQAWHPGLFRQMARSTAGVCVELETDARRLALEVRVDPEPKGTRAVLAYVDRGEAGNPGQSIPHDGVSVYVDGRFVWWGMPNERDELLVVELPAGPEDEALGLQPLPGLAPTRHVRLWLPALRGCEVRDVRCDGSFLRPVAHRRQLLVLGDSIAQGFVSGDPACAWPSLLAARQGLDLVNQGLGGQVFQPGSLFGLPGLVDPVRIVVAYGANYRYEPCIARRVSPEIRAYLNEVARLWPQVPTHVLTPLWHNEGLLPSHRLSCHEQVPGLIAAHAAAHDNMTLVDGLELLEHDPNLLADGYEHPNARGCRQVAMRLNTVMRLPGLRPSLVGKRRKRQGETREKLSGEALEQEVQMAAGQLSFDDLLR